MQNYSQVFISLFTDLAFCILPLTKRPFIGCGKVKYMHLYKYFITVSHMFESAFSLKRQECVLILTFGSFSIDQSLNVHDRHWTRDCQEWELQAKTLNTCFFSPHMCFISRFFLMRSVTWCFIYLGRVLAQVSCELVPPKPNRPTEGVLFFNLELSPMAAPGLEPGR